MTREEAPQTLGERIYAALEANPYLQKIHDALLYNYAVQTLHLDQERIPGAGPVPRKAVPVGDAIRFADLLSKSTNKEKKEQHRQQAQELAVLLHALYPHLAEVRAAAASVLGAIENDRGRRLLESFDAPRSLGSSSFQEDIYDQIKAEVLAVPGEAGLRFFLPQKTMYDRLTEKAFSFSAPTSLGKSFIMQKFMKYQVEQGSQWNFARLLPTRALINEARAETLRDLAPVLQDRNYRVITSAGEMALEGKHHFILLMTPERLLYLLSQYPQFPLRYLFVDEAQKLSAKDERAPYYYKAVSLLAHREVPPHFIFASPHIPNPEVYLDLLSTSVIDMKGGTEKERKKELKAHRKSRLQALAAHGFSTTFSPVTQFKFLIDCEQHRISIYNAFTKTVIPVSSLSLHLSDPVKCITYRDWRERNRQGTAQPLQILSYHSSRADAVKSARIFASKRPYLNDPDLDELSKDIKQQIHGAYFLSDFVRKGVGYHVGYLPASLRMRLEDLYRKRKITAMFCTSTLMEGVNLPADELYVTSVKNGRRKLDDVEFQNLLGRVGRIQYHLSGNVFLITNPKKSATTEEYTRHLTSVIPNQTLSITGVLKTACKEYIARTLRSGSSVFRRQNGQSEAEYGAMRKYGLILLKDILDRRESLVWQEFKPFLSPGAEEVIRHKFQKQKRYLDHDINISPDQTARLEKAIRGGLRYPVFEGKWKKPDRNFCDYDLVFPFLKRLAGIFCWQRYEHDTLGKTDNRGNYTKLRWYATLLCQWMEGRGLQYIIKEAIKYREEHRHFFSTEERQWIDYKGSDVHKNYVFAETLDTIETVILFKITNYFLRFSIMYKRIHGENSLQNNDWYEFAAYGTTDAETIFLQKNGFSRESALYIRGKGSQYLSRTKEGYRLRKAILSCGRKDVEDEAAILEINEPDLFI